MQVGSKLFKQIHSYCYHPVYNKEYCYYMESDVNLLMHLLLLSIITIKHNYIMPANRKKMQMFYSCL